MDNLCSKIKEFLENSFSMPFIVSQVCKEGELRYICQLQNVDNMYFDISIYIHNNIRLIVEISPQKHGGYILTDMALATLEKRHLFLEYMGYLQSQNAKVKFVINNTDTILNEEQWPCEWKTFLCRISLLPIPEIADNNELLSFFCSWLKHGINLIFSLLTISDNSEDLPYGIQSEGNPTEVKSIRYERNKINRDLCLAEKGYSCSVCGITLEDIYGPIGHNYIEVHHVCPVSTMDPTYVFNVHRDLVPLCPNCHSMIHRRNPPFTIEELKGLISQYKDQNKQLKS